MTVEPSIVYEDDQITLYNGRCEQALKLLPANSVDAVICDPPYGMSSEPKMEEVLKHWLAGDDYAHKGGGFMGKSWDSFVPGPSIWKEAFRVLKPGGMLAAFASTRTADLMGIAIRLAGFERRDTLLYIGGEAVILEDDVELAWLYGSGFPKEGDLGNAVDVALGYQPVPVMRESVTGGSLLEEERVELAAAERSSGIGAAYKGAAADGAWAADAGTETVQELEPVSEEGKRWRGWSTALKPANEPIILARKPISERNVALNVVKHGTGGVNIAGATVGDQVRFNPPSGVKDGEQVAAPVSRPGYEGMARVGRWPANVLVSHVEGCQRVGTTKVRAAQSVGNNVKGYDFERVTDKARPRPGHKETFQPMEIVHKHVKDGAEEIEIWKCVAGCPVWEMDKQGASEISIRGDRVAESIGRAIGVTRFFYCAKPTREEKDAGISGEGSYVANRAGGSGIARDDQIRDLRKGFEEQGMRREEAIAEAEKIVGGHRNTHLTVKPIELMRWLVRLLCAPGGTVLDPFMGSGTTGCAVVQEEGMRFVGVELDAKHAIQATERILHWRKVAEEARLQLSMF